jgi:hypothetical protein
MRMIFNRVGSDGYCAYSVSESAVEKVQFYIQEQKTVHLHLSYTEEINQLNLLHKVDMSDVEAIAN